MGEIFDTLTSGRSTCRNVLCSKEDEAKTDEERERRELLWLRALTETDVSDHFRACEFSNGARVVLAPGDVELRNSTCEPVYDVISGGGTWGGLSMFDHAFHIAMHSAEYVGEHAANPGRPRLDKLLDSDGRDMCILHGGRREHALGAHDYAACAKRQRSWALAKSMASNATLVVPWHVVGDADLRPGARNQYHARPLAGLYDCRMPMVTNERAVRNGAVPDAVGVNGVDQHPGLNNHQCIATWARSCSCGKQEQAEDCSLARPGAVMAIAEELLQFVV